VFESHPTIDSIMLNAGTQHSANFAQPETVNLATFHREITIALVHTILPHLLSRATPTNLTFTGTQVSLIPAFPLPAYSASKAALDAFIMCLREQLRGTNVTVQHISPGPVQTELHDTELGKPAGRAFGMPMEDFVSETWSGLIAGEGDIFPGTVGGSTKEQFLEVVRVRDEAFGRISALLRTRMG
jgi:short-subunit dehydrogenase